MKVTIVNGDFILGDEAKDAIETRIRLALSRFSTKISRVTLKLTSGDDPAKEHKICRLEVLLRPTRTIVAEDKDADLQAAVDRAAIQMARSLERKFSREQE